MLKIQGQNWVFAPIDLLILHWLSKFDVHTVASFKSISIVVPPFLVLVNDQIFPDGRPVLIKILLSSVLS